MAREYTEDEVRQQYLELVWDYIDYWHNLPDKTCREKMEGLAFGMLVILDGGTSLPGFVVAPSPHPGDKEYHKENEENWFPENHGLSINCDIAGVLHELFHKIRGGSLTTAAYSRGRPVVTSPLGEMPTGVYESTTPRE